MTLLPGPGSSRPLPGGETPQDMNAVPPPPDGYVIGENAFRVTLVFGEVPNPTTGRRQTTLMGFHVQGAQPTPQQILGFLQAAYNVILAKVKKAMEEAAKKIVLATEIPKIPDNLNGREK